MKLSAERANECGLATKGEFINEIQAIACVLDLIDKYKKQIDLEYEEQNYFEVKEEIKEYFYKEIEC